MRAGELCGSRQQGPAAVFIEAKDVSGSGGKRHLADPGKLAALAHHHARLGVCDKVGQLSALVGCIQGQVHQTGPKRCQVQNQSLYRFFDLDGHPGSTG